MPERSIAVRLSVNDAEQARTALRALGSEGEAALKKIEMAAHVPVPACDKSMLQSPRLERASVVLMQRCRRSVGCRCVGNRVVRQRLHGGHSRDICVG